jgi:hypothetical protein
MILVPGRLPLEERGVFDGILISLHHRLYSQVNDEKDGSTVEGMWLFTTSSHFAHPEVRFRDQLSTKECVKLVFGEPC